ncbi:MAG: hypothetical protein U9Q07_06860 [Planctomycetota bacterium]|nr:hypothetical protein [Planctomycetota bacterium]
MLKNEADFKKTVSWLNIDNKPNPAHRESLRRQMLFAFDETGQQTQRRTTPLGVFGRTIMRSPIMKLATAAGIIIATLILIHQFGGSVDVTTAALAQAIENTKKMPWMHVINESYYDGAKERTEHRWYHFASNKQFLLASNGGVWCWDNSDAQKRYVYDPHAQKLTISDLPDRGFHGSDSAFSMLKSLLANWDEQDATIKIHTDRFEDRNVKIYEIIETLPDDAMSIGPTVVAKIKYRLVADIEKPLIVAGRIEHLDKDNQVLSRIEQTIHYPETGPEDIYALGVPRTAEIVDKTDGAEENLQE